MKLPIFKSLNFWTLLAGLTAFVVMFYQPDFPLSKANILSLMLFVLGLVGIVPTIRVKGLRAAMAGGIVNVLAFWQLVAGFVIFVITYYAPAFPFTTETLLGVILFVLSFFQIKPQLQAQGFKGLWK